MNTKTVKSAVPVLLIGATWLIWALAFPLYRPLHFAGAAVVSALVYGLSRSFVWRDRTVVVPDTPVEEKKEEVKEPQTEEEKALAELRTERDKAVSEMRRLNDAIADPAISAQIDHLEEVTGKIIDHVIANPAKQPQISRFLDYFLPTTIKLLNAYDRMDSAGVSGSNIDATKTKVEQMLNTLCAAFDKQLDALFSDEALDISTDITVMENLLAQEGLSGGTKPTGGTDGPKLEL